MCVCVSAFYSSYLSISHSFVTLSFPYISYSISLPNPSPYSLCLIQATLIAGCGESSSIHPSPFTLIPHRIPTSHLLHPPLHLLLWDPSVFSFLYYIVYPADYSSWLTLLYYGTFFMFLCEGSGANNSKRYTVYLFLSLKKTKKCVFVYIPILVLPYLLVHCSVYMFLIHALHILHWTQNNTFEPCNSIKKYIFYFSHTFKKKKKKA